MNFTLILKNNINIKIVKIIRIIIKEMSLIAMIKRKKIVRFI